MFWIGFSVGFVAGALAAYSAVGVWLVRHLQRLREDVRRLAERP